MNFFSRKGDLRDYNEIIDNKNAEDKHKMTFAEYKKLNESNKLKHL